MFQYFEFCGEKIAMFPFFTGMGILAAAFLIFYQLKRMQVSSEQENQVMPAIPLTFFSGVIGGCAADIVLRGGLKALITAPTEYGLTFYGWLIGGIVFLRGYSKICALKYDYMLNLFLPSFALAQSLGRIGCFAGGCCYGAPAKVFGISYPVDSLPYIYHGSAPLIPVQLYESAYLFIVHLLLFHLVRFKYRGVCYLLLMPAGRFFLEFFRSDDRGTFLINILSPSQWISIGLFIGGLIWFLKIKHSQTSSADSCAAVPDT